MITLVLGGARSGKSEFAERLAAAAGGPVVYVATADAGTDPDFAERIRRHRQRRPPQWQTAEAGADLTGWLERVASGDPLAPGTTVLVDSLGVWVAAQAGFDADGARLAAALRAVGPDCIVVSEEVGLGVHPSTEIGGRFRDALGTVNQAVAAVADAAYLIVAGRPLPLGPLPGTQPCSPP